MVRKTYEGVNGVKRVMPPVLKALTVAGWIVVALMLIAGALSGPAAGALGDDRPAPYEPFAYRVILVDGTTRCVIAGARVNGLDTTGVDYVDPQTGVAISCDWHPAGPAPE